MSEPERSAGVIGLGMMGGGIARHAVAAGLRIHGFDVSAAAMAAFERAGGVPAGSAAEVAEAAELVVTSLSTAAALRSVVTDIAPRLTARHVVAETSTFPLADKLWVSEVVEHSGAAALDCTLSGTGGQMRERDIVVYASGDEAQVARCGALFAAFSRQVYYLGAYGNGSRMKFIANHLVAVHNVAAAEALLLARQAGMDLAEVLAAVTDGAGTSRMLEVRGPMMVAGDYSDASFRLDGFQKDVDIIAAFAKELHVPMPLFAASAQVYQAGLSQGRGALDPASVFAVLEHVVAPATD